MTFDKLFSAGRKTERYRIMKTSVFITGQKKRKKKNHCRGAAELNDNTL